MRRPIYLAVLLTIACADPMSIGDPKSMLRGATSGATVELYLMPDRDLIVGDNSTEVHARIVIDGKPLSGPKPRGTFSSDDESVISVLPEKDQDHARLVAMRAGKARITAQLRAGNTVYIGMRDFTVVTSGGSTPVPQGQWRWPTARTMVTDFYYNWTPELRDIAARRFDYVMSGSLDEWKSRNPDVRHLPYQTHWAVGRSDTLGQSGGQASFESWYAANCPGRSIEEAYLHRAGTSKTYANRLRFHIWSTHRFAFNPGDPCWRQYQQRRIGQALAAGSVGVFYDEYGAGIMTPVRRATLEYSSATAYDAALIDALKAERTAHPKAILMLNTAEYVAPEDEAMILAAGSTHLELFNDLSYGGIRDRWTFTERLLGQGLLVQYVGRKNWKAGLPSSMTPGNYRDAKLDGFAAPGMYRQKMGELASYYLVQDAAQVRLLIDTNNDNWSVLPTAHWLRAQEIDVGQPVGSRREIMSGTDPQGQGVSVWQREFSRAWILARPSVGWDDCCYGDAGAVTVQLPSPGRLLHHDGTLGPTVTQIKLRKAEGAILIKQ